MCGIAGAISFDRARFEVTDRLLDAMGQSIAHRGPDGAGTWRDGGRVGLAHRRLAIIDLSETASQPMASLDNRFVISFNGEIWNHAALRVELERRGHRAWRTDHSDTEVILAAFREWGIDCLERLDGMFAIALWDAQERCLWLVRDRIGVKPLYYARDDRRLVFASEIKALFGDPTLARRVDEESVVHFMTFLATPAPRTLFDGVRKLAGGTWLRVSAEGEIAEGRYWDAWDGVVPLAERSDDALAEEVRETLRAAVRRRKVGDVPVGVFLSGGIDSTTNVALFSEGETAPVKTFSIAYDRDYASNPSELGFARLAAQRYGAEHHEMRISEDDLIGFLPRMVHLQDEPIADPVCVPLHFLARLARDHGVKVAQIGEGADELFWGYPDWGRTMRLQSLADRFLPRAAGRLGVCALHAAGRGERLYTEYLRRASLGQSVFWGGVDAFTDAQKRLLLSSRLRDRFRGLTSWDAVAPHRRHFEAKAWERSDLNWMTHLDLHVRLPELLLMRVDKMTMGVGLEAREPFLDPALVRLALAIPTAAKMRGGELKAVLKRAVAGLLPPEILSRRKQGFSAPMQEWSSGRVGEVVRDSLAGFCRDSDLLDRAGVERFLAQGRGMQAWFLANFAMWWRHFIKGESLA